MRKPCLLNVNGNDVLFLVIIACVGVLYIRIRIGRHDVPFVFNNLNLIIGMQPIWGWLSDWLGILDCAPLKVSSSISTGVNFGGLVHTEFCSGLERAPTKWMVKLVPSD